MRDIDIDKVVVHMGVGESGEKVGEAENIMKSITRQKPVRSIARTTSGILHQKRRPDWVQGHAPRKISP